MWPFSHQLPGLLGWCLPVVLLVTPAVRAGAPVVARHLPPAGVLALRDYGAIGRGRRVAGWVVTAYSGLIGAASHLALDRLEVSSPAFVLIGHGLGVVGAGLLVVHIGRRRLLRRWHGVPPVAPYRPGVFWTVTGLAGTAGVAVTAHLPAAFLIHTTAVRLLGVLTVALLAGAAAVTVTVRRR